MDVVTMMWTVPAVGGMLIALLGLALWSLARDPVRMSRAREEGHPNFCTGTSALATGVEDCMHGFDARGVGDGGRMQGIAAAVAAGAPPAESVQLLATETPTEAEGVTYGACAKRHEPVHAGVDVAREVRRLAALATPQEEIACRLGIAAAEVRLLIGMQAARGSLRGAVGRPEAAGSSGGGGKGEADE